MCVCIYIHMYTHMHKQHKQSESIYLLYDILLLTEFWSENVNVWCLIYLINIQQWIKGFEKEEASAVK